MPLLTLDWLVAEAAGKFSVNHWRLTSCDLRTAGLPSFGFIYLAVVYSLEWDSRARKLTLEGEVIGLIRNLTSSEINCKAGNSNRLIDNTISLSLNKGPEREEPYEILCSSADLTASLFQWSKSIHIFQPRVMSGSFA